MRRLSSLKLEGYAMPQHSYRIPLDDAAKLGGWDAIRRSGMGCTVCGMWYSIGLQEGLFFKFSKRRKRHLIPGLEAHELPSCV